MKLSQLHRWMMLCGWLFLMGFLPAFAQTGENLYVSLPLPKPEEKVMVRYVRTVDDGGNEGNDGLSWVRARANLQNVIEELRHEIATNPNVLKGRIYMAGGIYRPTQTTGGADLGLAHASFKLYSGIEVYGSCDPGAQQIGAEARKMVVSVDKAKGWEMANPTILTGSHSSVLEDFEWVEELNRYKMVFPSNSYHVVWFATGEGRRNGNLMKGFDEKNRAFPLDGRKPALLDGVVIQGGNSSESDTETRHHNSFGGGVYMVGNSILRNSEVRRCHATRAGGGIYMDGGGLVDRCYVHTNQSEGIGLLEGYGGGICVADSGIVTHSLIVDNMARCGGGMALVHNDGEVLREDPEQNNELKPLNRYFPSASSTIVSNNTASTDAGGLLLYKGGTVNHMTITNNHCSGSEIVIRRRRYGMSGGAFIEEAGVMFNSLIYGNEVRKQGNSSIQFATHKDNKEDKENRPYLHYCGVQNLEQTDWSGTTRRGVISLTKEPGPNHPGFHVEVPGAGVQQTTEMQGIVPIRKGTYEQVTPEPGASRFQYYWKPKAESLIHSAGVNLSSFVTRNFMLLAKAESDFDNIKFSSKSTLGARVSDPFLFTATNTVLPLEGQDNVYTLFVDPNVGYSGNEGADQQWGGEWAHPFLYLEDALEYVREVRRGKFENTSQGISIPKETIFQILVKEGESTTASNHYGGDLHEASISMVDNTRVYGGFPKSLTGTSVAGRNPHLYPSVLSADVLKLAKGRNSDHVVKFCNVSNALLDGFHIEKGYALGDVKQGMVGHAPKMPYGAGILISMDVAGKPMVGNLVRNCKVANCSAEEGAAVWAKAIQGNLGTPGGDMGISFENCIFHNNTAHVEESADASMLSYSAGTSAIYIDAVPGHTARVAFNHCNIVKNKGTAFTTGTGDVWLNVSNSVIWANAGEEMADIKELKNPLGFDWGGTIVEDPQGEATYKIMFDYCLFDKGLHLEDGWTNCQANLTYKKGDRNFDSGLPTYPECVNPTKNIGATYGVDQTLSGGRVDFTPHNMNPVVNAANPASMNGKDFTAQHVRNYGGAADIGALENTKLPKMGSVIYVRDLGENGGPGGDGLSWATAINGNSKDSRFQGDHGFKGVDAEIPTTNMTGLQWAVDEAYYLSLKKTGNAIDYKNCTTYTYWCSESPNNIYDVAEFSKTEKTGWHQVSGHVFVDGSTSNNGLDLSEVDATKLVQVWVAEGEYSRSQGFFMRNSVDVLGGFQKEGNPGLDNRNPKTYTTIIETNKGQEHDFQWGPTFSRGTGNLQYDLNTNYENANHTQRVLTQPIPYYMGSMNENNDYHPKGIEWVNLPINGFDRLTTWDGFTIRNGRTRISNGRDGGAGVQLRHNGRISNCVVCNNKNEASTSRGGGIYCNGGTIENCLIKDNALTANGGENMGGGLYLRLGTVFNTSIVLNDCVSNGYGSGIFFEDGMFYNNTVTQNKSCIAVETGNWFKTGKIRLYNCIIWGNVNPIEIKAKKGYGSGLPVLISHCLLKQDTSKDLENGTSVENLEYCGENNPFKNSAQGNYTLRPGTPENPNNAINSGTDVLNVEGDKNIVVLPNYDADYNPRIQDCRVDIGAYEYNGSKDIKPTVFDPNGNIVGRPMTTPAIPTLKNDANKLIFYVTQNGAGDMSGNIDNPACAEKLQKVLDAAGRERANAANNGKEIVVRLAGDKKVWNEGKQVHEWAGFCYSPTRNALAGNDNPRMWSLMVPHGITLEGGWTEDFNKLSNTAIPDAINHPSVLSGIYHGEENDVVVYHVVTFTNDVYGTDENVLTKDGLKNVTQHTIVDGIHIRNGRADGEIFPHNCGGAAIVPDYGHVRNCILEDNFAIVDGGALYLEPKSLVSGCLFKNNVAQNGGAIAVKKGNKAVDYSQDLVPQVALMAHVYTCTFVSNKALNEGGAIWFDDNIRVNSSVLWNNEAAMNMNISGQLNPLSSEQREATLLFYPLAYCAVENLRVPGLNNIKVNSDNSRGTRFEVRQEGSKEFITPYYVPTSYSLLARAGMPVKDYEILVTEKQLAKLDFSNILRGDGKSDGEGPYSNVFIEIGARAFDGRLTAVPDADHLLTRLFVAQQDVDWDLVLLLENLKGNIYSIKGSSFAYPMIGIEEALEYIRNVRNDDKWKEKGIGNQKFEIFVAGGTYFPLQDIHGQNVSGKFEESSRATYLIPEGVSIFGGLDNVERKRANEPTLRLFYGQLQKTGNAKDSIADITLSYGGGEPFTVRIQQEKTPAIMNERGRYDRNVNGIVEPWEMEHQTILSGNVVDKEENVHHVVTCIPYGVGQLPDAASMNYGDDLINTGVRPSVKGGEILFDGVEIIEGEAIQKKNSGAENLLADYADRGGAILVAGNIGQNDLPNHPEKWGWVGPVEPAQRKDAVGKRNISLVVRNCRFNGNKAGEGGAIFTDGELKIYSSSFERNHSLKSGNFNGCGGAVAANYEMTAINTIFENNEAGFTGTSLTNVDIPIANAISEMGTGGAVFSGKNGWTHMMNCNMVRNKALNYPALYLATPNKGKPDYDNVMVDGHIRDAFANGADRHMIVNSLFWGNEAPGGVELVVNYQNNDGSPLTKIEEIALPTEGEMNGYLQNPSSVPALPSEVLWFCAYEEGCGLAPVKPKIKGVDMREAPFDLAQGCHYLPQVFYAYLTDPADKGLGKKLTTEQEFSIKYLANYNVWLNRDNYDLNGPNFSNPSTEAGVHGYDVSASWMVTRTNNLTDNGWTMLEQVHSKVVDPETSATVDVCSYEIDPVSRKYKGSGIYYDWYYTGNPDFLNFDLGMDVYMKSTFAKEESKKNHLRVSVNPDLKMTKTYIDIGVYEFRHIKLIPYVDNQVDVLWVCQYERPGVEADGHTVERATSNVQGAIETLLSSRNDHHKEIRFLEGEYTPTVSFDHQDGINEFSNKGFLVNTAHQDKRAKVPQVEGVESFGVRSLAFRGGWSKTANTDEGIQNVKEFPTYISSLSSAWPERHDFHHLFYIEDALQRKSASGAGTNVTMDGTVVPIIFDGLTLVNEYAANENGSAIYYKEQQKSEGVAALPPSKDGLTNAAQTTVPKLAIHRCHFLGNAHKKVSDPALVTAAVTVEKGGGRALIYNSVFHSNIDRAFKVEDTDVLNCTFALNGKASLMNASSTLHNSVFWKNNPKTGGVVSYGMQLKMLEQSVPGTYDVVDWNTNPNITFNALTAPENVGDYQNNVVLSDKNSDLIFGPNFKDPREVATSLSETSLPDIRLRDFSLLPSMKLLNKGSTDIYAGKMAMYGQAIHITAGAGGNNELTPMSKEEVKTTLLNNPIADELQLGKPIRAFRTDVDNLQRVVDNGRLDLGAYEYQQPLRRVIYVDPNVPGAGGNGSSWMNPYSQSRMQDAIDMAAVYAQNNFAAVEGEPTEDNAEAYVFIRGADFSTEQHLTMRAGVKAYGSIDPGIKNTAEVDGLNTNTPEYTAALKNYIKFLKNNNPGLAAPMTRRTIVKSILASEATAGHHALMDGFEVKGTPEKGNTYEEINRPVVDLSIPDVPNGNPTVLMCRNLLVHGFHNVSGADSEDNAIVKLKNGLLYHALIFDNKVNVPAGDFVSNNYGIVTFGNGDEAQGHLLNCTVVGEEGMERVVNAPGTSAANLVHNTIVYPGKSSKGDRPFGFCTYFQYPEYDDVFYAEPFVDYQLAENSMDINTGSDYSSFSSKLTKYDRYINYQTDFDLLGNPRIIGPKVDRGCYETWSTKDGDLELSTDPANYGGWFFPQRGSVVYLDGHALKTHAGYHHEDPITPAFVLLREGGGWYTGGNCNFSIQYAAVERQLGLHNLVSLPFPYDYSKKCKKVTFDVNSQLCCEEVTPIRVAAYNAETRAASNYLFEESNSSCWEDVTADHGLFAPNVGVGLELPEAGTYRFFGVASHPDEVIYAENDQPKKVMLKQVNSKALGIKNEALFTSEENMGWNLTGQPYLVSSYLPYAASNAPESHTGYAMDVPHLLWGMGVDGNYKTSASWEDAVTSAVAMKAGEGYFMQTAILAEEERLFFDFPTPPAEAVTAQKKRISLRGASGCDELVVNPSAETMDWRYSLGADGVKWMAENEDLPQIYLQNRAGTRFAWTATAPVATELKLGVRMPVPGEYTFAIPERSDFDEFTHIWLTDREENVVTDLKAENYQVTLNRTLDSAERFTLKFGGAAPVADDGLAGGKRYEVFIRDGLLHVRGLEGGEGIHVYDAVGRDVLSDVATEHEFTAPLATGVYVVKVNGNVYKLR